MSWGEGLTACDVCHVQCRVYAALQVSWQESIAQQHVAQPRPELQLLLRLQLERHLQQQRQQQQQQENKEESEGISTQPDTATLTLSPSFCRPVGLSLCACDHV